MRKQVLGCLGVAALVVLVLSLMGNVLLSGLLFGKNADLVQTPDRFQQVLVQGGDGPPNGPRIAQINLSGVIMSGEDGGRGQHCQ